MKKRTALTSANTQVMIFALAAYQTAASPVIDLAVYQAVINRGGEAS